MATDLDSSSTESGGSAVEVDSQHGAAVTIVCCHHHSPPHTSPPHKSLPPIVSPPHKALEVDNIGEGVSAEELDLRLQKQLESRANEWYRVCMGQVNIVCGR